MQALTFVMFLLIPSSAISIIPEFPASIMLASISIKGVFYYLTKLKCLPFILISILSKLHPSVNKFTAVIFLVIALDIILTAPEFTALALLVSYFIKNWFINNFILVNTIINDAL